MSFCIKCGAANSGTARFCPKCGAALQPVAAGSTNQQVPAESKVPKTGIPERATVSPGTSQKHKYIIGGLIGLVAIAGIFFLLNKENTAVAADATTAETPLPVEENTASQDDRSAASVTDYAASPTNIATNGSAYKNYVVTVGRTYFYSEANESTKKDAFLLKNQTLQACCEQNGFLFTLYTNDKGKTTEGWIKASELMEQTTNALEISAYLVYDDGTTSDFNLIDNNQIALWNTIIGAGSAGKPSHKTKIVVEGQANDINLVVYQYKTLLADKTFSVNGTKEFIIDETGCEALDIQLLQNGNVLLSKTINFECGE